MVRIDHRTMVVLCLFVALMAGDANGQEKKVQLAVKDMNPIGLASFGYINCLYNDNGLLKIFGERKSATLDLNGEIDKKKLDVKLESKKFFNYFRLVNYGIEILFPAEDSPEVRVAGKLYQTLTTPYGSVRNKEIEVVDDSIFYTSTKGKSQDSGHDLVRYKISDILSKKNTEAEVIATNVVLFMWGDGSQNLFIAYENLDLQWGTARTEWTNKNMKSWRAVTEINDMILLSGFSYPENINTLVLLNRNLQVLSTKNIRCTKKGSIAEKMYLGAINLLSEPVFEQTTAYVLAPCGEDELNLISVSNNTINVEVDKLSLKLKGFFSVPDIKSVVTNSKPKSWIVSGFQWIKEVSVVFPVNNS